MVLFHVSSFPTSVLDQDHGQPAGIHFCMMCDPKKTLDGFVMVQQPKVPGMLPSIQVPWPTKLSTTSDNRAQAPSARAAAHERCSSHSSSCNAPAVTIRFSTS